MSRLAASELPTTTTTTTKGSAMRLYLQDRFSENTILGYEFVEPVSYGYCKDGKLRSIVCRVPFARHHIGLVAVEGDELDDLMLHYAECAEYSTDHPPEESPMGAGFRAEGEALRGV